jgi:hypothetical protein
MGHETNLPDPGKRPQMGLAGRRTVHREARVRRSTHKLRGEILQVGDQTAHPREQEERVDGDAARVLVAHFVAVNRARMFIAGKRNAK